MILNRVLQVGLSEEVTSEQIQKGEGAKLQLSGGRTIQPEEMLSGKGPEADTSGFKEQEREWYS